MRKIAALAAALFLALPAEAALAPGAKAPDFETRGAIAGKPFRLSLAEQLKKGPVVLYFFPAAFTAGCTAEAHEFAEASDDFRKAGATVIGMSADPIDKLAAFSKEACRDKFAVASATPDIVSGYDVRLKPGAAMTSRTSYVIAPNGRILYAHNDMNYRNHVKNTLAAVRKWRAAKR